MMKFIDGLIRINSGPKILRSCFLHCSGTTHGGVKRAQYTHKYAHSQIRNNTHTHTQTRTHTHTHAQHTNTHTHTHTHTHTTSSTGASGTTHMSKAQVSFAVLFSRDSFVMHTETFMKRELPKRPAGRYA